MPNDVEEVTAAFRLTWAEFSEMLGATFHALGLPERRPNLQTRLYLRWSHWRNNEETFVGADRDGIVVHAEGFDPVGNPWSAFGLSFETQRVIGLLLTETAAPILIPKRSLADNDLRLLRRLIEENLIKSADAIEAMRERRLAPMG